MNENLDYEPGWWLTLLILLPLCGAVTVASKVRKWRIRRGRSRG